MVEKGWPDKDADGDRYELNIFIIRPADALMEVSVVFEDGETATWELERVLEMYDKLSMKKGTDVSKWEHESNDDPDDMALMDAVLAAGVTADGFYPGAAAEPEAAPEAEPVPDVEYASLALNIKNKTGKTIDEVYIYPAGGDKGASVVEKGWPDKDADGDRYELNIFIIRPADALMEVSVVFEDGETATWELERVLEMYDKLSMKKGTDVSKWEHESNDDPDDMALMDAVLAAGVTADGFYPGK